MNSPNEAVLASEPEVHLKAVTVAGHKRYEIRILWSAHLWDKRYDPWRCTHCGLVMEKGWKPGQCRVVLATEKLSTYGLKNSND